MLRHRALELLREVSDHGVPLENHCRRLDEFARALAAKEQVALEPAQCKEIFARIPRAGFNRVLLAFFKTAIVHDGPAELLRVFFPLGGLHSPL